MPCFGLASCHLSPLSVRDGSLADAALDEKTSLHRTERRALPRLFSGVSSSPRVGGGAAKMGVAATHCHKDPVSRWTWIDNKSRRVYHRTSIYSRQEMARVGDIIITIHVHAKAQ